MDTAQGDADTERHKHIILISSFQTEAAATTAAAAAEEGRMKVRGDGPQTPTADDTMMVRYLHAAAAGGATGAEAQDTFPPHFVRQPAFTSPNHNPSST